jgi:hypothetical protein
MAETITYPESGYGIMPSSSFNNYLRYSNQRRAATGFEPSTSDKRAFWEGSMDALAKQSANRAALALERKRTEASIDAQNKQLALQEQSLENQEDASKRSAISSFASIPLTYMMYKSLGMGGGGKDAQQGTQSGYLDTFGNWVKKKLFPGESYEETSGAIPMQSSVNAYEDYGQTTYDDMGNVTSSPVSQDTYSPLEDMSIWDSITNYSNDYAIPAATDFIDIGTETLPITEPGTTDFFDWTGTEDWFVA